MIRFGLILGGLLLAMACSSPASTQSPVSVGKQVTMRVDNSMQFATPALEVQAGRPLELTLENVGGMPHDFTLGDGVSRPVKIEAKGGETSSGTFTIDQ